MDKEFIFSIGLNVGDSEPAAQLHDTLRALVSIGTVRDVAIGNSAWQGVPERFVQARVAALAGKAGDLGASLARELSQSCVAWRAVGALHGHWWLSWADGRDVTLGESLSTFPVILGAQQSAPAAVKEMPHDHSGIQSHSMGKYFPAVIARIESAGELYGYELTIGGYTELYATRDDAEKVARFVCQHGRIDPARYAEVCA